MQAEAALVRWIARLSQLTGRGGSVLGGRALLSLDGQALRRLSDRRCVCLVSGTNGKTTTTAMLTAALGRAFSVASNSMGSNLVPGLITALASDSGAQLVVLEADEAVLPKAASAVDPAVVVLLNLSRDQLDRFGEVRLLAAAWRAMCSKLGDTVIVANADDPLVTWAASASPNVRWLGSGLQWQSDAATCPACGERIGWHGEDWSCSSCSLARPAPMWSVHDDRLTQPDGAELRLDIGLPGPCNLANAAAAIAAASALGVDPRDAARELARIAEVEGRYRQTRIGGVAVRILLGKNPAGLLNGLDMLRPSPVPVLLLINAQGADGRDPSWLWDVPIERIGQRRILVGGDRARDLAVRLHYAGLTYEVMGRDLEAALSATGISDLDVIANYTAFQAITRRRHRGG